MKLIKEFKEFAIKGNMIDMAIGIIIGASFNTVVDVLVKHIIMPPLSLLTSGVNLHDKKIILRPGQPHLVTPVEEIAIDYGLLLEAVIDFLIIGFTIFFVIRLFNKLRNKAEDPKNETISTPKEIELLSKMNDLLEEQNKLLNQKHI